MDLSYEATSRTLKIDTGTLHYHVAGTGEPLILLHGSGPGVSGWSNFGNNLPAFAAHFRCYIVDLPGFLGLFAGKIRDVIQQEAPQLLK